MSTKSRIGVWPWTYTFRFDLRWTVERDAKPVGSTRLFLFFFFFQHYVRMQYILLVSLHWSQATEVQGVDWQGWYRTFSRDAVIRIPPHLNTLKKRIERGHIHCLSRIHIIHAAIIHWEFRCQVNSLGGHLTLFLGARTDTFLTSCSTLSEGHIFSICKNIGFNMFDKPLAKPVHSLPCHVVPTLLHTQPLCVSFLNATRTFSCSHYSILWVDFIPATGTGRRAFSLVSQLWHGCWKKRVKSSTNAMKRRVSRPMTQALHGLCFHAKERMARVKSMQWRFGYSMILPSISGHHGLLFRIPYAGTEFTSNEVRKSQARGHHGSSPDKSIKALYRLRETASLHSPRLVHLLHTQQAENDMVPTGFITYVLMTWCPGSFTSDVIWFSMPLAEKYAVREAFKNAMRKGVALSVGYLIELVFFGIAKTRSGE